MKLNLTAGSIRKMLALTISFNFAGQRGSDAPAVAMTNSGWVPEAFSLQAL